ncbi:MAG: 2Fe-2S iron-sulfur cluster-binding protein [Accumulibacter sp.]|jgi:ferredoxin|uniref:(2Fe-2S)-binding protein n=2 Tax=Candidatus Accumulibacter TaxID=327159 RepID=A0A080M4H3_9PROT|nr:MULTISPECIES: 2Fe-2S iron-sulfur cluster-binding protein [Candidatus Accumulibacter]HNF78254.1 2Fe-2S iron-sulfur cluster-binding protein [Thauera aminoaromatica]KFB75956.1 MAG: 2Fe-2S iron-sulfur cluster binding domain protein [Candidatus Accumulibacter cognatus]MBL8400236.1 (2Fe-2S)-binding protein [Accumulibacter sp.]MBL8423988.1 (2Fe-2S)-binding protein [Candidatus Accumulibacter phosphatis]MBN8519251.1 (2Fe-2S)-binding protein [Accumulibacter sp.]
MPNITFSSPMHKDKTIYAVAGSHTQTILKLAKENHVPIDFSCGDGECGTCLVKVSSVDKSSHNKYGHMGGPLNVREVAVLKEMGKIKQAQIEQMYVDDLPPTEWRLACQYIVRDEDILVEYPSR